MAFEALKRLSQKVTGKSELTNEREQIRLLKEQAIIEWESRLDVEGENRMVLFNRRHVPIEIIDVDDPSGREIHRIVVDANLFADYDGSDMSPALKNLGERSFAFLSMQAQHGGQLLSTANLKYLSQQGRTRRWKTFTVLTGIRNMSHGAGPR